jgi:hypothetical protein
MKGAGGCAVHNNRQRPSAQFFFSERSALLPVTQSALGGPLSVTRALSQHKIFENEFSFAAWKWRFALLASDVVIGGFRPGFCFDNLIQRFAARAEEQWRTVVCHQNPPRQGTS